MCTQPIRILNRKYRNLSLDADFKYLNVSCGQCDECLQKRSNDVYVRARSEYDECLRTGGIGFMCCLTYSNDLLPTYEELGQKYMVFNKKHVIDFIKRLRTNLDRYFQEHFFNNAPDFKYLITAEFGSSEIHTHRPHYHLLFFFKKPIGVCTFRSMFIRSMNIHNNDGSVTSVFGKIFQCDVLDPARGGVKYSAKYVLKDSAYQRTTIKVKAKIKFYTDYANQKFGIIPFPKTADEFFRNRIIRASKEYKRFLRDNVLPFRHMLQFYMCSNDLGASALVARYGESVLSLPSLNFEGFTFSFPKLVKTRIGETYGIEKLYKLQHIIFKCYLDKVFNYHLSCNNINLQDVAILRYFYDNFVYYVGGRFYLFNPLNDVPTYDEMCQLDDDGFFELRNRLYSLISVYESEENRNFRASVAAKNKNESDYKHHKKQFNNSYKYEHV